MINPGDLCLVISGPAAGCSCIAEGCVPPGECEEVIIPSLDLSFTITNTGKESLWICTNDQFITEILERNLRGIGVFRQSQLMKIGSDDVRVKNREVVLQV